jgi:1-acyl-sn-glycerol-3-phosphate acyltransferase
MQYLRSLLFVLAGLAASVVGTKPMRSVVHGWADFHHWLCLHVLGIRAKTFGIMPREQCIIAVKHQSMYETIEILRLANTPVVVMKRELADMPLFGWITRCYGVIAVDRAAGPKALRAMLAEARKAAESGRPIAIFPEGTRVLPGETPPLRPGFSGLYRALGLPVVPIAMDSGRLWGRGVLKKPGTVHFQIAEIIPTGLGREDVEARVHAGINLLESSAS